MSNHVDMMKRQTRNHPGLTWEAENVNSYGFTDINRIALDDNYGKVAAPLSKRRNGSGPAGRDARPGLFGLTESLAPYEAWIKSKLTPNNMILGTVVIGAVLYYRSR